MVAELSLTGSAVRGGGAFLGNKIMIVDRCHTEPEVVGIIKFSPGRPLKWIPQYGLEFDLGPTLNHDAQQLLAALINILSTRDLDEVESLLICW